MSWVHLNDQEMATVLGALRFWQDEGMADLKAAYADHFEEEGQERLCSEEVDDLCEYLNMGYPILVDQAEKVRTAAREQLAYATGLEIEADAVVVQPTPGTFRVMCWHVPQLTPGA